jgi:hypothetical protein
LQGVEKFGFTGCSKMSSCKSDEILKKKAYLQGTSLTKADLSGEALAKMEDNAADGRFSSAC